MGKSKYIFQDMHTHMIFILSYSFSMKFMTNVIKDSSKLVLAEIGTIPAQSVIYNAPRS